MTLNALSNVTVNITSSPLAKSFVDVKTGLTAGLNCISFAFSTVKLLFWDLIQLSYRVNGVLVPEMNLMLFDLNEAVTMV